MNNVHAIIGSNGIGKTRFMIKKIEEAKNNHLRIVTNLPDYRIYNSNIIDNNKINALDNFGNPLLNELKEDRLVSKEKESLELLRLIMTEGDILILDEIDAFISHSDIPNLMAAIADTKDYWKDIYISGYNSFMDRVFVTTDKKDYTTIYDPNYCMVDDSNLELKYITEDEAYEYFDSI